MTVTKEAYSITLYDVYEPVGRTSDPNYDSVSFTHSEICDRMESITNLEVSKV